MPLTQISTNGIKDGQVHTADLADAQITAGKLHADALDRTYTLGADGSNHYTFTGEGLTGAVNDPTLYLTRGKTYRFVNGNSAGAHPFRIQTTVNGSAGTEYNTGVTNNGGAGGSTIVFEVPHAAPDVLYYQCTSHGSMGGILYVTGALADGTVTTNKLAADAVDGTKIADNSINSEHYVDGSIDNEHIADDAINSEHYADLSINNAHLNNSSVTTNKIENNAVTLGKLEQGTSSNDGKFLRANNGADPTFETVSAGVTVSGNVDNRVITGDGTNLVGESQLEFIGSSGGNSILRATAPEGGDMELHLRADESDDNFDRYKHVVDASGNHYRLYQMNSAGTWTERVKIHSDRGNIEPTHDPMGLHSSGLCVALARSNNGDQNDDPNFKVDFTVPMGKIHQTKRDDAAYGATSGQTRYGASPHSHGGSGILIASCHGNYYWGMITKIYHISTVGNGTSFHTRLDQLHSYSYAGHPSNNAHISLSAQSHSHFTPTIRATFGGDYWSSNCLQITYVGSGAANYTYLGGLTHLHSALVGQDQSWK